MSSDPQLFGAVRTGKTSPAAEAAKARAKEAIDAHRNKDQRISRDVYGLRLAAVVASRADCTRRQVGAVLMDPNHLVVSTGYNGAPAGVPGCASAGNCPRGKLTLDELPPSQGYELAGVQCIAVHAEMNAVIYAGRARALGGTLFVTDAPCYLCRLVIQAGGLRRVVWPGGEWCPMDDRAVRPSLATGWPGAYDESCRGNQEAP